MPLLLTAYHLVVQLVFPAVAACVVANGHCIIRRAESVNRICQPAGKISMCPNKHYHLAAFGNFRQIRIECGMPEYCITIGMKQILASRRIYIALNREWQHGIAKHVLFDKPQAQIPATLLQGHANVTFCTSENIAKDLF